MPVVSVLEGVDCKIKPYINIHGSHNFRQRNFTDFSRIFQGQITVLKDNDLFNKSAFFNCI